MNKFRKLQISFADNLFLGRTIVVFATNLATKLIIVCLWEKKDFPAIAKGGQTTVMTNLSIFLIMKNTKTVFVQYIKIYYRTIFSGK